MREKESGTEKARGERVGETERERESRSMKEKERARQRDAGESGRETAGDR